MLHERELAKWKKSPMVQGKFYQSLLMRELLDIEDLSRYYDSDLKFGNLRVEKNGYVIYLDSIVIEFDFKRYGKSYQTFIKVLTEQGYSGWVIWFSGEWKRVRKCR